MSAAKEKKETVILIAGAAGLAKSAELAACHREALKQRYSGEFVESACELQAADEAAIALTEEYGRGENRIFSTAERGFLAALWEMAEELHTGLRLDLRRVPVLPQTTEVCEFLDLDPFSIPSAGCLLIVSEEPFGLAAYLEEHGILIRAAGRLTPDHARILLNDGRIRYLDRP